MTGKVGQVRWEVENVEGTIEAIAEGVAAAPATDVATLATAVVGGVGGVEFTVGASDTGTVALQLVDHNGDDLAVRGSVFAYLSDDANGDSLAATAPSGGIAIGTDGLLIPVVADKAFYLVSEADGDIDLLVTEAGGATWYLIVILPNGLRVASSAIVMVVP